ncbi:uncharacterized protein ccdc33 [Nelusetta ayraudi]|uniref:uncharacterized protein ccdc33 n=1 Tax=Nelusetta ayraudi TaxID=303726 RepID=UPI003F71B5D3
MKALKKTKLQNQPAAKKGGFDLPSYDALAQLLPNHRRPLRGATAVLYRPAAAAVHERPPQSPEPKRADKPNINRTYHAHHLHTRQPLHDPGDDPRLARITNLQNEVIGCDQYRSVSKAEGIKNYDSALNKMAEDIVALRRRVAAVEAENRLLRTEVPPHQDLGHNLVTDWDVNTMAKTEVAHLIDSLKRMLATETRKAASQRDRIHQQQNDLIKSCGEKERLNLQRVQQQRRQEDLQLHQSCSAKIENLEATVKQQRQIIKKMERALERSKGKGVQRKESLLALRTELAGLQQ